MTVYPVILCGGSGTRLWPASRKDRPKQFLKLTGDGSLLQDTVRRALRVTGAAAENVIAVTLEEFADETGRQIAAVAPAAARRVLREPEARGTAPAVACALAHLEKTADENALLWVLPSDHHIRDEGALAAAFRQARAAADAGYIAALGIPPTRAETAYGWLRPGLPLPVGGARKAAAFIEKPDAATAQSLVEGGAHLWNSGMILARAGVLGADYARLAPACLAAARAAPLSRTLYAALKDSSLDRAILEKSGRVAVVPCDPGWSDIGAWDGLWEISAKEADGNAVAGDAVVANTKNCLIRAHNKRLVACTGVEDLVIVDTHDALLVARRGDDASMRALADKLAEAGRTEIILTTIGGRDEKKRKAVA